MGKFIVNREVKPRNAYFEIEADGYEQNGNFVSFYKVIDGEKSEVRAVGKEYIISLEPSGD